MIFLRCLLCSLDGGCSSWCLLHGVSFYGSVVDASRQFSIPLDSEIVRLRSLTAEPNFCTTASEHHTNDGNYHIVMTSISTSSYCEDSIGSLGRRFRERGESTAHTRSKLQFLSG
jgi:hypothetical protein